MIRILWATASVAILTLYPSLWNVASAGSVPTRQIASVPTMPLRDLGRAPAAMMIQLAVVLPYRHEAELEAFVGQAANAPAGATRVLSAEQFRAYFAPSPDAYARVAGRLAAHGLMPSHVFSNRTVIDVTAPVAVIERAFATAIHRVAGADGAVRYANVRPVFLPADLQGDVYGILGFSTVTTAAGELAVRPSVVEHPPLNGPGTGFGPAVFARAYDMPIQHQIPHRPPGTTYDGRGVRVAVIANDDFRDFDLATYLRTFGIDRTGPPTRRIPIDGGPGFDFFDSGFTTLQVEVLVGTSPGIGLYDYGIPANTGVALLDAMNRIDSDDDVSVALSPAFDCEGADTPSYESRLSEYLALQGNALGIVYVTDSGDPTDGGECIDTPATDPHVIAVGGTTLIVDARANYMSEFAYDYSVGGSSSLFELPSYQVGVANITEKNRVVPDVAFDGDYQSGADEFFQRQWVGSSGGSELSAAIFASLAAQLTQVHGGPLGDLHPALYGAFKSNGYATPAGAPLFHDVTLGTGFFFPAKAGFDRATGIGSIDGWNFALTANL
jgi:subtilase family serine protease